MKSKFAIMTPDVVGLRWLCESDARTFSVWEKNERPYPWMPNHFIDTIHSTHQKTLVWETKDLLIGFVVVQIVEAEAYLLNVMVNPEKRGMGFGFQLLSKALDWVRQAGGRFLFLDVDPMNKAALRLYKKLDFETFGRRPRAYPRGEDSILMRKTL